MRSLDDVRTMIHHAKLNERNLTGTTQTIYFATPTEDTNDFKLLELNPHLLSVIEQGDTLCFKGVYSII